MGDLEDFEEDSMAEWEEVASFCGPCTCDHGAESHGWGSCDMGDCSCEAGWEE